MKKEARNSAHTKKYNRKLILRIIRKSPVSRAEIARITGLTRAAVTIITEDLVNEGLLFEKERGEADYGRKPVILDMNPESLYATGINLARDGYYGGIVNIKGELIHEEKINIQKNKKSQYALNILKESMNKILKKCNIPYEKVIGMGISSPGPVNINNGTILNPPGFDMWHNINIVEEFKNKFTFDIHLENISTALTLAEKNYGKGSMYKSFLFLVVDNGIGGGIILHERIYRGVGGHGSEIGHTTINMNGRICRCGNRGCLEMYASVPAILKESVSRRKDLKSWNDIVDGAEAGDRTCIGTIEKEAGYLSAGIVNVMNVLELEAVILNGYIRYRPRILLDKIYENINKTAINRNIRKIPVLESGVCDKTGVLAAASIALEKFFS